MSDSEVVKKPNFFAKIGLRLSRWFREMRSELKKVVWPTRKQLINNTIIVVVAVVLVSAVIGGFDWLCYEGVTRLINALKVA